MEQQQLDAFHLNVRQLIKNNSGLRLYTTKSVIDQVKTSTTERNLTETELAGLPHREPKVHYILRTRTIAGIEVNLTFGYDRQKKIVDARIFHPAPPLPTPAPATTVPAPAVPIGAVGSGSGISLPRAAGTSASTRQETSADADRGPSVQRRPAQVQAGSLDKDLTRVTSFGLMSYPDSPATSASRSSDEGVASQVVPPSDPVSVHSARSGQGSPAPVHRIPSGGAIAARLRAELTETRTSPPSDVGSSESPPDAPSRAISLLHMEQRSAVDSPGSMQPSSGQRSVVTITSVEEALDPSEEKIISGEVFTKTLEQVLGIHYPQLTGGLKESGTGRLRHARSEERWRSEHLSLEHLFMYATLHSLKQTLIERGIDHRGAIYTHCDIDALLEGAVANAVGYCEASTIYNRGPGGPLHERINRFVSATRLFAHIGNIAYTASETLELLHERFDQVRGFRDIPAHERWRFVIDPVKMSFLPDKDNQLLVFLCDYDKEYAVKMVRAIPVAMDENVPVSLELIRRLHEVAAEGSIPFTYGVTDSNMPIAGGFREEAMTFVLTRGLHLTEAGLGELERFRTDIEELRSAFLKERPDMETAMKDSDITMVHLDGGASLQYRRGWMPKAFLEFCIDRWGHEMLAVLDSDAGAEDKKRAAILFCKRCEHLHPFMDGNGRVFEILLPMRLFQDIDGSLPMLDYPCRMDGHSVEELLDEFRKAQADTARLKRGAVRTGSGN